MERDKMESIKGFLSYTEIKYLDMNQRLKGLHLKWYSWRPLRDKDGWRMQVEQLKLA